MNIQFKLMAVVMIVIFIYSNSIIVFAGFSLEYAGKDYRNIQIHDIYDNEVEKPIAQFKVFRERNNIILDSIESYAGNDLNEPFPVLDCYVGDTISFEDKSNAPDGANICEWDFQIFGSLGEHYNTYNYNVLEGIEFTFTKPGTTTFFLCVRSDVEPRADCIFPWSENGNHQIVGKNSWFPDGAYWYFTAVVVNVMPVVESKVHMQYWDIAKNETFYEETKQFGELKDNETITATVNIPDWDGYRFEDWNIQLSDGTIQQFGDWRIVSTELAGWLPEKYLNIKFAPYTDTELKIKHWVDGIITHEESLSGGKTVADEEKTIAVEIPIYEGYEFNGWNVQLPDERIQYSGNDMWLNVYLSGYVPIKYLNIEYSLKNMPTPTPTPTNTPEPTLTPESTPGNGSEANQHYEPTPTPEPYLPPPPPPPYIGTDVCDGSIVWSETDTHKIRTGTDKWGYPIYATCTHTFTYNAKLTASATVSPDLLKSGYGFDVSVMCDNIITEFVSNVGNLCNWWGNDRAATSSVIPPTKAIIYLPWTVTNSLGTQGYEINMERHVNSSFRLPVNPISVINSREIFTNVTLAGTAENPRTHSFDIYISGGGVNSIEFCKKLTKIITIRGSMHDDDGTTS